MAQRKRTILMYSRSRGGKTTLVAEFAEAKFIETGKPSLVYSVDKGGTGPLMPMVELGVIVLVEQEATDPWIFLNNAAKGFVRDAKGKWVAADLSKYAMVVIESMTSFSDMFMNDLAEKAGLGQNIGGSANVSFTITGDDQTLRVGGSNQSHYGIVQNRILNEVWKSQRLPVPYILWTAGASKEDDMNAGGKVIGPAIAGKALTAEMPRHFDLTFRLDCTPAQNNKPEIHTIYLGNSVDQAAGNAVSLGNTRVPMGAEPLPPSIVPASLVGAMKLIEKAEQQATAAAKARLAGKGGQ